MVSIIKDAYTDTFIVNEGSFEEPMQWMHRKGYSAEMLARVGITAGASAPEVLVQDVVQRLCDLGATGVEHLEGKPEDVVFALPKELRISLVN